MDTATQAPKPEPGASPPQQFLRLPVDSARKLRYYDRPELSDLVATHARDMATLQAANAALKQVRSDLERTERSSLFARPWSGLTRDDRDCRSDCNPRLRKNLGLSRPYCHDAGAGNGAV